ncbi:MAG: hypothetical protein K940chlam7_01993 [Chlamydiae bacterium]|nr:hypothetical protein [Chlamydiota bacterium]
MFEVQLFLGFPVDALFEKEIEKINPNVVAQFIQKEGDYLRDITHDGMRFLGKNVGKIIVLPQLEMLEANIYSILKKIVPDFPYQEVPLYLFAIEDNINNL